MAVVTDFSESTIQKIVDQKIPCVFVSPHLDDAILSAGGLIEYLSKRVELNIVSVFTSAPSKGYTLSARMFLKQCNYKNALDLFNTRKVEDLNVCEKLHVHYRHLDFVDALFRTKSLSKFNPLYWLSKILPEFNHVYPTYRWNVIGSKISPHDDKLLADLRKAIKQEVSKSGENAIIFAPAGFGNHIDHIIIREICSQLSKDTIFWSDFPYELNVSTTYEVDGKTSLVWDYPHKTKIELINFYTTQVPAIFKDRDIPLRPEVYYR